MHKSGFKKEKQKMENIMYTSTYDSAIGSLLLAADDIGLVGLWLNGDRFYANLLANCESVVKETPILEAVKRWLDVYFSGREPKIELPIHLIGTPFRQEVWQLLLQIPYGKVITVGKIREYFAELNGADFTEPITAGIFVSIAAWASYQRSEDETPYWRTLKANGELNAKYPGGIEAQKEKLEAEGHTIIQKGRTNIKYFVKDYESVLFDLR